MWLDVNNIIYLAAPFQYVLDQIVWHWFHSCAKAHDLGLAYQLQETITW